MAMAALAFISAEETAVTDRITITPKKRDTRMETAMAEGFDFVAMALSFGRWVCVFVKRLCPVKLHFRALTASCPQRGIGAIVVIQVDEESLS